MTYLVTDDCIKCKHMDCVEVCPVDCFYEGENFLVINPDECIDCGVCEAECPVNAILPDNAFKTTEDHDKWYDINMKYSLIWPVITEIGTKLPDAAEWEGVPNKYDSGLMSELPGKGDFE
jgi:ferredoxin